MRRFTISLIAILWYMAVFGVDGEKFTVNHPIGDNQTYDMTYQVVSEEQSTVIAEQVAPYIGGDVVIPDYVVHPFFPDKRYKVIGVGEGLFKECNDLYSISLPSTLLTIGNKAFYGCKNLKSVDFGGVTEIGEDAFNSCCSLLSLHFPESLETIGDNAFYLCTGLGVIIIPDNVRTIGEGAFYRCDNSKTVVLGKGVTFIGVDALTCFPDIPTHGGIFTKNIFDTMYSFAVTPPRNYGMSWDFMSEMFVPEESIKEYEDAFSWSHFSPYNPLPKVLAVFYQPRFTVEEGEEIELEYALFTSEDVDIESMKWEAFNDKALAIDDGIATGLRAGEMTTVTLTITDTEGNEFQAQCQVEIMKNAAIDQIDDDASDVTEIFNINGVRVSGSPDHLSPGIYILKSGRKSKKIIVR